MEPPHLGVPDGGQRRASSDSVRQVSSRPLHSRIVTDPATGNGYYRGRLLGKGGFARCYELMEVSSGRMFAAKVISRAKLTKPQHRDKVEREISVHRMLHHKHVVKFEKHFETEDSIFILLELCNHQSLAHLLRKRHVMQEADARCCLRHILLGLQYLHARGLVHRDLKLANLFISGLMEVKIGDLGLATRLRPPESRRRTVCGTPNYLAPEVLERRGHGPEADVWSLGCVMYTLLIGRPPFESRDLEETYRAIRHAAYPPLPILLSPSARSLLTAMLTQQPDDRPTLDEILSHDFLTKGFTPDRLPLAFSSVPPVPSAKTDQSLLRRAFDALFKRKQDGKEKVKPEVGDVKRLVTEFGKNTLTCSSQSSASDQQANVCDENVQGPNKPLTCQLIPVKLSGSTPMQMEQTVPISKGKLSMYLLFSCSRHQMVHGDR
uniref:Polo-like kinase 3 (Drosophila) n=1 Tax=Eptatretus burgeri TaxID=7764 RepID=A0A8C4Q2R8_EPTBU